MKRKAITRLLIALTAFALCTGGLGACGLFFGTESVRSFRDEPPAGKPAPLLADDRIEDKHTTFDPDLIDRRPLDGWLVNASEAVVRLDVDTTVNEKEAALAELRPSFSRAESAARAMLPEEPAGTTVLPSVNLIDGKAKQFDDGVYAALDQAYYTGLDRSLESHVRLVRRVFNAVGPASPAAPWLAAGLQLAGENVDLPDAAARAARDEWLRRVAADPASYKPIGFYGWNTKLADCFRFLRFFQTEFATGDAAVPAAVSRALAADPALTADYRKALDFYARLTNPYACHSFADVIPPGAAGAAGAPAPAATTRGARGAPRESYALFPASRSPESLLFNRLFPAGLPPDADLMRELITRVRSGEVDLRPTASSGWYDRQVYALEALVLPEKAEGADKLMLTRAYKERSLEAFRALLTRRRETHVRQLDSFGCAKEESGLGEPPGSISPRLRVEPCAGYYLRTARAYRFLADFLESAVGADALRSLHGLTQSGPRTADLYAELHDMRDLFYGLYLVSAEDVGLAPRLTTEEAPAAEACYTRACRWLDGIPSDPDLSADTRVAVPVYADPTSGRTRLWATLGVRTAKLTAEYADVDNRPLRYRRTAGTATAPATTRADTNPSIAPADPTVSGDWVRIDASKLGRSRYLIAGEEFAEIDAAGPLTRAEFRAICDANRSREAIVKAVRGWRASGKALHANEKGDALQ